MYGILYENNFSTLIFFKPFYLHNSRLVPPTQCLKLRFHFAMKSAGVHKLPLSSECICFLVAKSKLTQNLICVSIFLVRWKFSFLIKEKGRMSCFSSILVPPSRYAAHKCSWVCSCCVWTILLFSLKALWASISSISFQAEGEGLHSQPEGCLWALWGCCQWGWLGWSWWS